MFQVTELSRLGGFSPFTVTKRREALAFLNRIGAVRVGRSNRWTIQRGDRLMSLHIVEG
jgi:hypothetical protein